MKDCPSARLRKAFRTWVTGQSNWQECLTTKGVSIRSIRNLGKFASGSCGEKILHHHKRALASCGFKVQEEAFVSARAHAQAAGVHIPHTIETFGSLISKIRTTIAFKEDLTVLACRTFASDKREVLDELLSDGAVVQTERIVGMLRFVSSIPKEVGKITPPAARQSREIVFLDVEGAGGTESTRTPEETQDVIRATIQLMHSVASMIRANKVTIAHMKPGDASVFVAAIGSIAKGAGITNETIDTLHKQNEDFDNETLKMLRGAFRKRS